MSSIRFSNVSIGSPRSGSRPVLRACSSNYRKRDTLPRSRKHGQEDQSYESAIRTAGSDGEAPSYIDANGHSAARWTCRCDCGNITTLLAKDLRRGRSAGPRSKRTSPMVICGNCGHPGSHVQVLPPATPMHKTCDDCPCCQAELGGTATRSSRRATTRRQCGSGVVASRWLCGLSSALGGDNALQVLGYQGRPPLGVGTPSAVQSAHRCRSLVGRSGRHDACHHGGVGHAFPTQTHPGCLVGGDGVAGALADGLALCDRRENMSHELCR